MSRKRVLIATKIAESFADWLIGKGYDLEYFKDLESHDFSLLEGVVTSNKLFMPESVLKKFKYLKWIGRMGSGMEIIDMDYCQQHDIKVVSSPDGNANAVAEQALGTLLSLFHNIHSASLEVKSGIWQREVNRGYEIMGRKIGIIGLGNNGKAFAKKCLAMDMEVVYFDPYLKEGLDHCTRLESFDQLLGADIDVLSFHVPQNQSTWHYLKEDHLQLIKKPIYLLNLSRGAIVDWTTIFSGWKAGKILKAGLDVLEHEPLEKVGKSQRIEMEEMMEQGDLLLTPHIGGYTFDAIEKMGKSIMKQLCNINV